MTNAKTAGHESISSKFCITAGRPVLDIPKISADPTLNALKALKIIIPALEKLKTYVTKYKFVDKAEEIEFFRDIKPRVASQLIYYNEIYSIEANRPIGSRRSIAKYYNAQIRRVAGYLNQYGDFLKYYKTGSHYLDHKYFMRGKLDIHFTLDSSYLQADNRFSTAHDFTVAWIIASPHLISYLNHEINRLQTKTEIPVVNKKIKWTGSKVAMVELIYALHAQSVLKNGNASIAEIVDLFQTAFEIELGNFNRTFLEIRERSADRTKFLNALTNTLIHRMDRADEQ